MTLTDDLSSSFASSATAEADFPHRSTRELEAVFARGRAQGRGRRPMIGLGIAVGLSLAFWGGLAFLLI
ncbi:hypothetical protein WBP07_01805 [Novosphingobium sp. BL-8A]|uniref:hypothetical protein n=1 Tax=Novosphingobium sp. BL-8A TaxID=3127639 RepID=UPI003756E101